MTKRAKCGAAAAVMTLLAVMAGGCGGRFYSAVSSHTVATAPDTEMDVVWLEDTDGRVYRCVPGNPTPVCQRPSGLQ